jgi:hypothetical protein
MEDQPDSMSTAQPPPSKWRWRNLRFSHLATFCGIMGIPISAAFFFAGIREPNITYAINPIRVAVVRSGISSDLSILYKGSEIKKNVSSAVIEIWNAGRAAVDKSAVLEPLQIVVPQGNRILETHMIRVTRPIVEFKVIQLLETPNTLDLSFRILEHNDGVVLQLMYEGDPNARIAVKGLFVGQPQISSVSGEVIHGFLRRTPDSDDIESVGETVVAGTISLGVACLFGFLSWQISTKRNVIGIKPNNANPQQPTLLFLWVVTATFLIFGLYAFYLAWFVQPPLSFSA